MDAAATAAPFEITDADGHRAASNGTQSMVLLDSAGRMFRRRAVKGLGGGAGVLVEWVVSELHGVRVYFDGRSVVVTTRDITP